MITVTITGANEFLQRADAAAASGAQWKKDFINDIGLFTEDKLKAQLTPGGHGKITGLLQRRITHIASDNSVWVGTQNLVYAKGVNDGVKPHTILPRRKKILSFKWHGELVFFKKVNHPGYPGLHFVEEVLKTLNTDLQPLIASRTADIKKALSP